MKKILILTTLAAALTTACQQTDFSFDKESENGILDIQLAGQAGAATISTYPLLDTENENSIRFALTPAADFTQCEVLALTLSEGATANVAVGDNLDVTSTNYIDVTSANGKVRRYTVVAPARFDYKVGTQITLPDGSVRTLGEILCMGQNMRVEVNGKGDFIGFWRCKNPQGLCPGIHNFTSTIVHFNAATAAGIDAQYTGADDDNYFIFSSKGTYEYSYGKDGKATAQAPESNAGQLKNIAPGYSGYFIRPGRGYWNIQQGGIATGGNTLKDMDGVGLSLVNNDVTNADVVVKYANALGISGTYGGVYPGTQRGLLLSYWPACVVANNSFQPKFTYSYIFEYDSEEYDWKELLTDQTKEWFGLE